MILSPVRLQNASDLVPICFQGERSARCNEDLFLLGETEETLS